MSKLDLNLKGIEVCVGCTLLCHGYASHLSDMVKNQDCLLNMYDMEKTSFYWH